MRRAIEACVGGLVAVEDVLVVPLVPLTTVAGIDSAVFAFTTDIPWLDRWGAPLLLGPGSVTVAHTDDEYCDIDELLQARDIYAELAQRLLLPT